MGASLRLWLSILLLLLLLSSPRVRQTGIVRKLPSTIKQRPLWASVICTLHNTFYYIIMNVQITLKALFVHSYLYNTKPSHIWSSFEIPLHLLWRRQQRTPNRASKLGCGRCVQPPRSFGGNFEVRFELSPSSSIRFACFWVCGLEVW